jgi:predicted RND superfamily exporter protein
MKKALPYLFASVLAAFGLLTLFLSSSVIFDLFGVRAQEGNYVLFIVWANFLSSLFYLSAAYGFIESKKWTASLLGISGIVLLLSYLIHIKAGGTYETKTIGAMAFRITVTLVFSALAYFTITKNQKQ